MTGDQGKSDAPKGGARRKKIAAGGKKSRSPEQSKGQDQAQLPPAEPAPAAPEAPEAPVAPPGPAGPPIVAIGASAGGLEALQEFFTHVPPDCEIAFVVITHLRPHRESLMPELLRTVASMRVEAVEDDIGLGPNMVVVAKDSLLNVRDAVLRQVKDGSEPAALYHPIDHFFRELAIDQKERAIGIILSGSGNDGTLGIKAIKAAGGMVMVQEPATAKYSSMPDSALGTGLVDYVLPPAEMAQALIDFCRGPYLALTRRSESVPLPEESIHAILVRLRAHTGQDFTCYKRSTVVRRIQRRMNVHHIENPEDYVQYVRQNPRELDALLQELLISVTQFFRDGPTFDALAEKAVPEILASRPEGQPIRVWIPGCATGEEAYSIAILLHEQMASLDRPHPVQIFATDLDERAVETARTGVYPEGIAADVSSERLKRYFTREGSQYRIHKSIRDMIVFAVQNVISNPPFTRMDLIVCRNVLIYLDGSAQQRVLPLFHYALKPGGFLFLGTSETLGDMARLFEVVDAKSKILRRRNVPGEALTAGWGRHLEPGERPAPHPAGSPTSSQFLSRSIERYLLEGFAPCAAVVNEQGAVMYLHGPWGRYLQPEQGQPRNDILEMAREGLKAALAGAMRQARQRKREVVRPRVRVRTNGERAMVTLTVRPLTTPESLRGLLLVTIDREGAAHKGEAQPPAEPPAEGQPHEREDVERELRYVRENLRSTIEELETSNEELKSSNEELQSTNEELQSANEELETSREEMQSLNEELNTVNSELQSKVDALAHANDDMSNLLNSMQVATVFLDSDLRVKRYTEQARDVIRLIASDIGRPLSDLTSNLEYPELIEDCERVLATLIPREKEARDDKARRHLVRLVPYRTAANVIDGVVMTIVDVDRVKMSQPVEGFFECVVQTVREPLAVLNEKLTVVMANQAFYRTFDLKPPQVEGRAIYDIAGRWWDLDELRTLLEKVLPQKKAMNDYRLEQEIPGLGRRTFLLNARRLERQPDLEALILLAFEDVTEKA